MISALLLALVCQSPQSPYKSPPPVQVPYQQPVQYQLVQVPQQMMQVQYQAVQVQQPVQMMTTTMTSPPQTYTMGPGFLGPILTHVGNRMVALGSKQHTWTVTHSITRTQPQPQPAPPVQMMYQLVPVQQTQYQQPAQYQLVAQPSPQQATQPTGGGIQAPSENAPPPPVVNPKGKD